MSWLLFNYFCRQYKFRFHHGTKSPLEDGSPAYLLSSQHKCKNTSALGYDKYLKLTEVTWLILTLPLQKCP